jgi:predicted nucleotidyltransferase
MTQGDLLQRIKESLQALYGPRFRGLVLYGSVARGDCVEDSDMDMLALLDGPVDVWKEIRAITKATYSFQLEYLDRVFHI